MPKQSGVMGLFTKDGKMILVHRKKDEERHSNKWTLPSGHMEEGETNSMALVREMEEELGVTPTDYELILPILHSDEEGDRYWYVFYIKKWSGEITNKSENADFRWFTLEEAEKVDMPRADEYMFKIREVMKRG